MSLKNLIALQAKKAARNDQKPTTRDTARDKVPAVEHARTDPESTRAEQLPPKSEAAPAPAAPAKSGLGLNLAAAGRAVGKPAVRANAGGAKPGHGDSSDAGSNTESDDGAIFGLADLAGFDASDDSAPERPPLTHQFLDEIEATAPERMITPDLTAQQMNFIESLDSMYPVLHDPDLFGQSVRIIMLEMQENREYKKLISDQDVNTLIRGMRNTMGLAKIRKQEKSRKTNGGGAAKKGRQGKSSVSDDDMALLDSIMGGDFE